MPPLFIAPVTIELAEIPETVNVAVAPDPETLSDQISVPEIIPKVVLCEVAFTSSSIAFPAEVKSKVAAVPSPVN